MTSGFANKDPSIELQAGAIGITDSLHNDKNAGYVIRTVKDIAKARNLAQFDAAGFGQSLFDFLTQTDVKSQIAGLCGKRRQYSLVPVETALDDDSADIIIHALGTRIPPQVSTGLQTLGLTFKIESKRPPLGSLWEQPRPPAH